MDDSFAKFDQLRSINNDFVFAAEQYGRIIISERCVPNARKTIGPTDLGGVAGGQKFLVRQGDIMFKVRLCVVLVVVCFFVKGSHILGVSLQSMVQRISLNQMRAL
jgi:hypothetical protein